MKDALFDKAAKDYDEIFTYSIIGQEQRKRVYYWLEYIGFFKKVRSVFELNCGTGFDAEYFDEKGLKVRASDISQQMINVAIQYRSKSIEFLQLDFREINQISITEEAVFSNFGGLNCVPSEELIEIESNISKNLRKGNFLVWVIMPKFSLMEAIYFLFKFQWNKMFRRFTNQALQVNVDGVSVPTYFHSPKAIAKILKPNYDIKLVKPVALFLPPSYLEPYIKSKPKLMKFLIKLETVFGRFSFFSGWADHFIIIAEKK